MSFAMFVSNNLCSVHIYTSLEIVRSPPLLSHRYSFAWVVWETGRGGGEQASVATAIVVLSPRISKQSNHGTMCVCVDTRWMDKFHAF